MGTIDHIEVASVEVEQRRLLPRAADEVRHRVTPLEEIQASAAQGGRPSSLIRVDTDATRIADAHAAPSETIIASPQFVARGEARSTAGCWRLCTRPSALSCGATTRLGSRQGRCAGTAGRGGEHDGVQPLLREVSARIVRR